MKKFLTLAAAFVMALSMQAQIVTSTSRSTISTNTKPASEKIWLVRAGLNFMNFSGSDAKDMDGKMGYDVSFEFNKPISGVNGLYWGMEFGLGSRGASEDDVDMICHNVRFSPFVLGYKYNITSDFAIDAHIGAFVSADYTGKVKFDDDDDVSMGDWKDDLGIDWQRVDAGMRLGAGVWYKNFNLDFTWHKGFIKPYTVVYDSYYGGEEEETLKLAASNFMIRLGISF